MFQRLTTIKHSDFCVRVFGLATAHVFHPLLLGQECAFPRPPSDNLALQLPSVSLQLATRTRFEQRSGVRRRQHGRTQPGGAYLEAQSGAHRGTSTSSGSNHRLAPASRQQADKNEPQAGRQPASAAAARRRGDAAPKKSSSQQRDNQSEPVVQQLAAALFPAKNVALVGHRRAT